MRVLVITGDRTFKSGHPRFTLQAECVEHMEALYWGPGALLPRAPEGAFDVVSVQDPFLRGLYGLFLARRLKAKYNVQVHADLAAQPMWKRILAGFVLRRADSVRVVSENIKAQVAAYGVRAPVHVVPLFVDIEQFRDVVRAPDNPPVVLWVGRFEEEKDPMLAVRVFAEIHKRHVLPARLIMLGAGSLGARLKKEAEGLPVEFPGWQKDVKPYLGKASVVLSTSRAESWGASIVEALAAGVPVIAPDVGIAREAGAQVVSRHLLPEALTNALFGRAQGKLAVPILSRSEWQKAWLSSLH